MTLTMTAPTPESVAKVFKALDLPVSAEGRVKVVASLDAIPRDTARGLHFVNAGSYGQIVVPLDGTGEAEAILPFVVSMSQQASEALRLIVRKGGTTSLTGTPIEQYLKVLVNTLKEQHVRASGSAVDADPLTAAGEVARAEGALVAFSSRAMISRPTAANDLKGVPVLYYAP